MAVPSWSGGQSSGSSWTLQGGLRTARIGGIGYVFLPWWAERGEDLAAYRTGAIERGVLTTTVDTESRGGITISYYRLLKTSFRTSLVSTSVGATVVEESADRARLSLFLSKRSRVTKLPALSALRGLGGGVGGSDRVGVTGESD